jgi:fused signal recognition particle receptor
MESPSWDFFCNQGNGLVMGLFDFFSKEKKESLDKGLAQTRESFFGKLSKAVLGKSKVDEEVLDNLEEVLVTSDVGIETTLKIIARIEERVASDKYSGTAELEKILKEEIAGLLKDPDNSSEEDFSIPKVNGPYVMMVVGVNGAGKTTTIGKLATQFHKRGKKVVLGAGDTFWAAAVDQLKRWGERAGVPVIAHDMNTDPASVAFDAVKQAVEMSADIVIIDTAGRLHNKINLMNELTKIKRVIQKFIPDAPHEVLLVLDGSTGQNALNQAKEFTKATEVTALAITKLDGTAKGGVVIGISDQLQIPVKYIGVGEKTDDIQVFNKYAFVESLFKRS